MVLAPAAFSFSAARVSASLHSIGRQPPLPRNNGWVARSVALNP